MFSRYLILQTSLSLLTILLCLAAYWQVQRGMQKLSLANDAQNKTLVHQQLPKPEEKNIHGKINSLLTLDKKAFFLIDNQIHKHKSGYTLIGIHHDNKFHTSVLIDLGWVENNTEAKEILRNQTGKNMEGVFYKPSGFLWTKHPNNPVNTWPKHLNYLDMDSISTWLETPLYPVIILSKKARLFEIAFDPNQLSFRAFRHFGYTLQFLFFSMLCLRYQYHIRHERKNYAT